MDAAITHPTAVHRVSMGDHRWVSIRPIERSDGPGLSGFYARLSAESWRRRFLGARPPLTSSEVATLADEGAGLVAVLWERGPLDGSIVGHASVLADGPDAAEVAFAVADSLQGRGIGHALVEAAIDLAQRRGLRRVSATLLADNVPMRRLLNNSGCRVVADTLDAGVEEISLYVPVAA